MRGSRCWFAALLFAACTATTLAPEPAATGKPLEANAPRTLGGAMRRIEAHVNRLDRELLGGAPADLVDVAHTANEAAALIRLGYGEFERQNVPQFARMALDAESWFLHVALEARQGHGELAADLFRTGHTMHCTKCHDAVDRAGR